MNGSQVIEMVRQMEVGLDIRVKFVGVSAGTWPDNVDFLTIQKPIKQEVLRAVLESYLDDENAKSSDGDETDV